MTRYSGYCVISTSWTDRGFLGRLEILSDLTRSSESGVRSDVTDSLNCPDTFRLPLLV